MKKFITLVFVLTLGINGYLFLEKESLTNEINRMKTEQSQGLNEDEKRQIEDMLEESKRDALTQEEILTFLEDKLGEQNEALESVLSSITTELVQQDLSLQSSLDQLQTENDQSIEGLLTMINRLDESLRQEIYTELKAELAQAVDQEIRHLSLGELEDQTSTVVEQKVNTVVGVSNEKRTTGTLYQTVSTGSGVIFHRDGNNYYVITNEHVINGADRVSLVMEGNGRIIATVIGYDKTLDLALLSFYSNNSFNFASFMDSNTLKQGDIVLAMGNPLGYTFYRSVTMGIVSGLSRTISVQSSDGNSYSWKDGVIQHDAAISPGNSGGPLFNLEGDIVGINNAMSVEEHATNIGFAIPSNTVIEFIQRYSINDFNS